MQANLYTYENFILTPGIGVQKDEEQNNVVKMGPLSYPLELMNVQFKKGEAPEVINNMVYKGSFIEMTGKDFILLSSKTSKSTKGPIYIVIKHKNVNFLNENAILFREIKHPDMYTLVELRKEGHVTIWNQKEGKFYGIRRQNRRLITTGDKTPQLMV